MSVLGGWRGGGDRGLGPTTRVGLGVAALGAALAAGAPLAGDLARGEGRESGTALTATIGAEVALVGGLLAALLVATALVPRQWTHLLGIVLGVVLAYLSAGQVVTARLSRDFAAGADLEVLPGGAMLLTASAVALAGVLVALAGVRRSPRADPPAPVRTFGDERAPTSARAALAPVLGVVGILFGALPPLAIAIGTLALLDLRERPELRGRGLAVTGVAVGILVFSLYVAGLGAAALTAVPPG